MMSADLVSYKLRVAMLFWYLNRATHRSVSLTKRILALKRTHPRTMPSACSGNLTSDIPRTEKPQLHRVSIFVVSTYTDEL